MSFRKDLKEMIDTNSEVFNWITCGQFDDICEDTRFVVATTQINNGTMCGGDGRVFGEWTWFNNPQDLCDYITHLAILLNLCILEDQDPRLVMNGLNDEDIFGYEFSPKNIPIRDELNRLWKRLKDVEKSNLTFDAIKDALRQSQQNCEEIDGELIFGYKWFDNYKEACQELLCYMGPLDENASIISRISKSNTLREDEVVFLQMAFADNPLY